MPLAVARARARVLLRTGNDFVWNATNFSRPLRSLCLSLFYDYSAQVRIVYVETQAVELERRNHSRSRPVPASVIEGMIKRWEPPDLTESHSVDWV